MVSATVKITVRLISGEEIYTTLPRFSDGVGFLTVNNKDRKYRIPLTSVLYVSHEVLEGEDTPDVDDTGETLP